MDKRNRKEPTIIRKIIEADYCREGYADGFAVGERGGPRIPPKIPRFMKIHYFIGTSHAIKTYYECWKKGYEDGLKKYHGLFEPKIKNERPMASIESASSASDQKILMRPQKKYDVSIMSSSDSYQNQLRILANARNRLLSLRAYLESKRASYNQFIERASGAGFMDEYISSLRRKYSVFSQKVDNLLKITNRHLDLIDQMEDEITRLRTEAAKD